MSLEERVERLERQNRWLKQALGLGVVLAISGGLAFAQGGIPSEVVAKSFVVKDDAGRTLARLGPTGLTLRDAKGAARAHYGGSVFLNDQDGKNRTRIFPLRTEFLDEKGKVKVAHSEAGTEIFREDGKNAATLSFWGLQTFGLKGQREAWYRHDITLYYPNGKPRFVLGTYGADTRLRLYDYNRERVVLSVRQDKGPASLWMWDDKGALKHNLAAQ